MQQENNKLILDESFPISSMVWRSFIFVSLLLLLLYVGINWPC
ncbi:MAG: hypothetical protein RBT47_02110 [Anaerolineae bacterium]|jgi:hypothetical protein|nr:hypothetical protein [Anaerolineae bacterium]